MNARMMRMPYLCCVVLISLSASVSATEMPTAEKVLAIYQANREKLSTLHVQMKYATASTEARRKGYRKQADNYDHLIRSVEQSGKVPEPWASRMNVDQFLALIRDQQDTSRLMAEQMGFENHYEFYFQGEYYQVRTPLNRTESVQEDWKFPTVAITPGSLEKEYAKFRIYSHSAQSTPFGQIWPGLAGPGSTEFGMLSSGHVWKSQHVNFPPLPGVLHPPSGGARHPLDEIFSTEAEQFQVTGTELIDGRTLTIVTAVIVTDRRTGKVNEQGKLSPMKTAR